MNFDYAKPASEKAAIATLAKNSKACFIAGGTNLVDLMKKGVMAPEKLIDITGLPLRAIEERDQKIRIGSLAANSAVASHPLITAKLPLLAQALNAGASPQLRNMATVGGNMMQRTRCTYFYDVAMPCNKREPGTGCGALQGYNRMHAIFGASEQCIAVHPSDMCVALAALDAQVIVHNGRQERKIPFGEFHRLPGTTPQKDNNLQKNELILAVEIPVSASRRNTVHYLKVRDRASYAFALVSVAAAMEVQNGVIRDIRLAMGGVAHKPWRLTEAEKFLVGKPASNDNFMAASQLGFSSAKGFGYNDFKLKLGPNAIVTALLTAANIK